MVRVTLSNGEHDELVLGPFNQGVVMEYVGGQPALVDLATREAVAVFAHQLLSWHMVWRQAPDTIADGAEGKSGFERCFIQQVPISEQRMILGAELDVLVMEAPHCEAIGCREHAHCRRIQQVRARLEEIS